MQSDSQDFKTDIKALKIIHFAMLIGQLSFLAIVLFLVYNKTLVENAADLNTVFMYLVPLFALGGFIASQIVFRGRLNRAKTESGLREKLTEYRGALIVRYALLEGASLFAIIVYMVTGNLLFSGMAGILILYFLTLAPTPDRIATDLELDPDEKTRLLGED